MDIGGLAQLLRNLVQARFTLSAPFGLLDQPRIFNRNCYLAGHRLNQRLFVGCPFPIGRGIFQPQLPDFLSMDQYWRC